MNEPGAPRALLSTPVASEGMQLVQRHLYPRERLQPFSFFGGISFHGSKIKTTKRNAAGSSVLEMNPSLLAMGTKDESPGFLRHIRN